MSTKKQAAYTNTATPLFTVKNVLVHIPTVVSGTLVGTKWVPEQTFPPKDGMPGCTIPRHLHRGFVGTRLLPSMNINRRTGRFESPEVININYYLFGDNTKGNEMIVADVLVYRKTEPNRYLIDPRTGQIMVNPVTGKARMDTTTTFHYIDIVQVSSGKKVRSLPIANISSEPKCGGDQPVTSGCWIRISDKVAYNPITGRFPTACSHPACSTVVEMARRPWDNQNGKKPFLCEPHRPKTTASRICPSFIAGLDAAPKFCINCGSCPLRPWER